MKTFISQVTAQYDFDVILTGAGTSKFAGNSNCLHLNRLLKNKVRSIGTTDLVICFNHECALDNALLGLNYILFAQNLALKKSLSLSIGPDIPCPTGEVNRVVKGVTIYPCQK